MFRFECRQLAGFCYETGWRSRGNTDRCQGTFSFAGSNIGIYIVHFDPFAPQPWQIKLRRAGRSIFKFLFLFFFNVIFLRFSFLFQIFLPLIIKKKKKFHQPYYFAYYISLHLFIPLLWFFIILHYILVLLFINVISEEMFDFKGFKAKILERLSNRNIVI